MAIAEGLTAIKTGFDLAKSIAEYVKQEKPDPNEISSRLLLLQQYMLDSQSALNGAQEEIQQLKNQIEEQKRLQDIASDMEYVEDGGFYIRKSEKAAGKTIAYCPLCWKAANADVPLNHGSGKGLFRCGIHNESYETEAYRQNQAQARKTRSSGSGTAWS